MRISWIIVERGPQFMHQHLDVVGVDVRPGPDRGEDLLTSHRPSGSLDETLEHGGRLSRQAYLFRAER